MADLPVERLHVVTPLLHSPELSKLTGRNVWLKMENLQPGGSFKIRGIAHTMQEAKRKLGVRKFIGSSGGNAGMAMAVAAKRMNTELTLYIPETTKQFVVDKLKVLGADVVVTGENWNEANEQAVKALEEPGTFLVHPYDQPDTWVGHSTMVEEIFHQMKGQTPGCLVTCVGGGGLALGLLMGMDRVGWSSVPLVGMETKGAHCLAAAIEAGELVALEEITSIATSLGALTVAETLFNLCHQQPHRVISELVSDKDAKAACVRFATDMRVLVEPACGAALAAVYSGLLCRLNTDLPQGDIVVVVCGGNAVNLELILQWKRELDSAM